MNIHSDKNYHLGHLLRDVMLKDPDAVCQIDAATGEKETRRSVLTRATILAKCLRTLGLRPGDILVLGGDNHLNLHIPYYAALLNGYPVSGVDPFFKFDQIKRLFKQLEPKVAFCDQTFYNDYQRAVDELGFDTKIITFDGNNSMAKFIQECGVTEHDIHDIQVADFDTDKVYAWLVSTSGSTGFPKIAAMTHQSTVTMVKIFAAMNAKKELKPALNLTTVQWLSSFFNAIGMPAQNQIKVQTSAPATVEHVIDIINKYKPATWMAGPWFVHHVMNHKKQCDLSSFDIIFLVGASAHKELVIDLRAAVRPDAMVLEAYGVSECLVPVFQPMPTAPVGSVGIESPMTKVKLVDPVTEEIITEPNAIGELWLKGLMFAEYYKNPERTAEAITPDGWYKTGDLFRRDENGFYFFVERQNMLIRFQYNVVVPLELEEVIYSHDGVEDVCVSSAASADGELPAAMVVRKPGASVTAQEIKELVAGKLPEYKHLRGGVMFVDEIPMTSTGKIARVKVKQMIKDAQLE